MWHATDIGMQNLKKWKIALPLWPPWNHPCLYPVFEMFVFRFYLMNCYFSAIPSTTLKTSLAFCPASILKNMHWKRTASGATSRQPCPAGNSGELNVIISCYRAETIPSLKSFNSTDCNHFLFWRRNNPLYKIICFVSKRSEIDKANE